MPPKDVPEDQADEPDGLTRYDSLGFIAAVTRTAVFKALAEDYSDLTILSLLTVLQWQLLYLLRITDNS